MSNPNDWLWNIEMVQQAEQITSMVIPTGCNQSVHFQQFLILLTIISQYRLVQNATLTLLGNVCNPDGPDTLILTTHAVIHIIPKGLIKLLVN